MSERKIKQIIPALETSDGAGVRLKRSLGQRQSLRLDPFLLLDAFFSANADDYSAGFPPHPHRGFETVTYMLDGHMRHRDHLGNEGDLRAGGVQWMTAGRGVIHEERPQQRAGLMRGFQLWINLPAAEKMKPAAYQNIEPEQVVREPLPDGSLIRLVAGSLTLGDKTLTGPVRGIAVDPLYADIELAPGASLSLPLPPGHNVLLYPFSGMLEIDGERVGEHRAVVLGEGSELRVASAQGGRFLLLAGRPIGEPVVQYGPFVMNTAAEIEQALRDYRDGVLTDPA